MFLPSSSIFLFIFVSDCRVTRIRDLCQYRRRHHHYYYPTLLLCTLLPRWRITLVRSFIRSTSNESKEKKRNEKKREISRWKWWRLSNFLLHSPRLGPCSLTIRLFLSSFHPFLLWSYYYYTVTGALFLLYALFVDFVVHQPSGAVVGVVALV